jgi:hypothetical protein
MPRQRPPEDRQLVLDAVAEGARKSVRELGIDTGIPAETIRTWLQKDVQFRVAFEQAKHLKKSAPQLTRSEWDKLLERECRRGSIPAMRLWREAHGEAFPGDKQPELETEKEETPFGEIDQLAERRAAG